MKLAIWKPLATAVALHVLFGRPQPAEACTDECTQLTHHWNFVTFDDRSIATPANPAILGMAVLGEDEFMPVLCDYRNGSWEAVDAIWWAVYSSYFLTEDTSICTQGGNDNIWIMPTGYGTICSGYLVIGFGTAGHTLSVNLGSGDDTLVSLTPDQSSYSIDICGGTGNDRIETNTGGQYINGGAGNDRLWGGNHYDNVRGGAGQDLIWHKGYNASVTYPPGEDRLRGDNGSDCLDIVTAFSSDSSCGNDYDYYHTTTGQFPAGCEDPEPSCAVMGPD